MNTPIFTTSNGILSKNPVVATGQAYTDCSAWFASANKEYLTIPSNSSLQAGDIDFEIGGWVRLDSVTTSQGLFEKGQLSFTDLEYIVYYSSSSNRIVFNIGNGTTYQGVIANSLGAPSANTWYFIRAWRDKTAGTVNIKVNNGTTDSFSTAIVPKVGTSALQIGKETLYSLYLNGRLDSWYFQKRISTTAEATALYNAGAGRTFNDLTAANGLDTFKAGLTSWWDFNSESGTQFDSKGTNHLTAAADPIISPTINNGGFEDWTTPTNAAVWSENVAGSSTVNQETTSPYAGSSALRFDVDSSGNTGNIVEVILVAGKKYTYSIYAKGSTSSAQVGLGGLSTDYNTHSLTTSYTLYSGTFIPEGNSFMIRKVGSNGLSIYIDNVTLTSLGPTAEAGIAAGNAVDGNFGAGFNGSSQYLSKTDTASLRAPAGGSFEIGTWANISSPISSSVGIVSKEISGIGASGGEYSLRLATSNTFIFTTRASDNLSASNVSASSASSLNSYHFVRAGYDATNQQLYISVDNGTKVTASASGVYSGTNPLSIAKYASSYFFPGRMDGTYKIDRMLTDAEATQMYNNGKGLKYAQLPDSIKNDPALKGYWNLDERSGTRYDSTSNHNDLTDNGGVTQVPGVNYYGGAISKLTDLASTSNANQITLAKRPTWDSTKLNGSILFDGVDDGLVISGDKIGTGDVTVFAVINARGWGSGNNGMIINNNKLLIGSYGNIFVSSNNSTYVYSAGGSIALNTSYIVTVTRTSAGIANFYINGKLSGTANQNSGTPVAGSDTYIGNRAAGDRAFDGYIRMVGVIPRILTLGEIQAVSRRLSVEAGGIY